jgi:gas vesicle protein
MGEVVTTNQLMSVLESMHSDIKAVYEGHVVLARQIDEVRNELKEDIALVDAKVMGLSKRVNQVETSLSERIDQVEDRLSREIAEVRDELAGHRSNTEMHRVQKKRVLKKVV